MTNCTLLPTSRILARFIRSSRQIVWSAITIVPPSFKGVLYDKGCRGVAQILCLIHKRKDFSKGNGVLRGHVVDVRELRVLEARPGIPRGCRHISLLHEVVLDVPRYLSTQAALTRAGDRVGQRTCQRPFFFRECVLRAWRPEVPSWRIELSRQSTSIMGRSAPW